jgi:hypothetical protein
MTMGSSLKISKKNLSLPAQWEGSPGNLFEKQLVGLPTFPLPQTVPRFVPTAFKLIPLSANQHQP